MQIAVGGILSSGLHEKNVDQAQMGHLGLTQAAGTAELVSDLVSGGEPALSLNPYSPTRF